ncbi:glutamate-cysteine ligase catalytic subunit [Vararia minispora EC-137]|uniref:Glutamate-cysteine ligase catalytic subunit n=1 Tax=Vararia minispora EC-137 TaxID=1314806 RepID=A0ACB8QYN0_9AGAM|nr:glutamate-cysteine ligase catalytic subunit [Vararia minispora EC-137]
MGLLSLGTPLPWNEAKKHADHVRYHGISQFLNTWRRLKDRQGDELMWGDEIEYMIVELHDKDKNAVLSLCQTDILRKLDSSTRQIDADTDDSIVAPTFHPEYGRYMLESTPGVPYTSCVHDLALVEGNMRYRRALARSELLPNQRPLSITSFPRLGAPGQFTEPYYDPSNAVSSHSLFLPEEITNPHARFPTLTANIRRRRGSKVAINLPLFIDVKTPRPHVDPLIPWERSVYEEDPEAKNGAALADHIYMDAMGFGMGCCCLQLTFQACNVTESRRLYDAFVPVAPIMLALTAASPLYRGYIADVDCRWNVIAGSVDDRTPEERGLKPLKENRFRIPKSRYDSVDLYIADTWMNRPEYNDTDVPYDLAIYDRLVKDGEFCIDAHLSKHLAHLFIRDPIVIFSELLDQDDETSMDHFENIQSTNWQTVRFKPPPANSSIGWRVEFRSMEVQLTDFENAAFAVFIVLLSRAILSMNLNFYIPISKVDENMQRAQRRDALSTQRFFFRRDVFPPPRSQDTSPTPSGASTPGSNTSSRTKSRRMNNCHPTPPPPEDGSTSVPVEEEYTEFTADELMNGSGAFPGLIGLTETYLEELEIEPDERYKIDSYLDLVRRRANGSLSTTAAWMRNFVISHPAYMRDSVVSQEINYDLMRAVDEIERGVRREPTLLPENYTGGAKDKGCL